jgi:hypothetical protein
MKVLIKDWKIQDLKMHQVNLMLKELLDRCIDKYKYKIYLIIKKAYPYVSTTEQGLFFTAYARSLKDIDSGK